MRTDRPSALLLLFLLLVCAHCPLAATDAIKTIGRYRLFEERVANTHAYENRFRDVELRCSYRSPSGREVQFAGFFDGDGEGGGDATSGTVWKLRFLPDEVGTWTYTWTWSDGSPGGTGSFFCAGEHAGRGVLRPYAANPQWFAYNGTEPAWLKSYYETGHASIAQPFDWIVANVYQPLLDRGYNHLQVNWLLPLCCPEQYYRDGPPPATRDVILYQEGRASSSMNLQVWQLMERHLGWLNERDVGVHMFLGFEGRKNGGPKWEALSEEEKDFYVRYVVARIAPFANLMGWNFVWEDPGHRESHELGLARRLQRYDVFNHLRTYEDENLRSNEYQRPEYTFAAIENHLIAGADRAVDMLYWKTPWTHHQACLMGYVPGKPVYMSEGNALWRRYWAKKSGATQTDLRRAAWGCVTAAASFCWNGHAGEDDLRARGSEGLPFHDPDHPYAASARVVDVIAEVMTRAVDFSRMTPHDFVLTEHDPLRTWCLAEPGRQYLVFSTAGEPFTLHLREGQYGRNRWINTETGEEQPAPTVAIAADEVAVKRSIIMPDERRIGGKGVKFTPPDSRTDWVLVLRTATP